MREKLSMSKKRHVYNGERVTFSIDKKNQKSKCAICGKTKELVLDHCHTTGEYRGAICHGCNTAIGKLGDESQGVQRALSYLQNFESETKSNRKHNSKFKQVVEKCLELLLPYAQYEVRDQRESPSFITIETLMAEMKGNSVLEDQLGYEWSECLELLSPGTLLKLGVYMYIGRWISDRAASGYSFKRVYTRKQQQKSSRGKFMKAKERIEYPGQWMGVTPIRVVTAINSHIGLIETFVSRGPKKEAIRVLTEKNAHCVYEYLDVALHFTDPFEYDEYMIQLIESYRAE